MAVDIIARGLASQKPPNYLFVENYAALPIDPIPNQQYYCIASQGTAWLPGWLGGTYYPSGPYVWNAGVWRFIEGPIEATQEEVDAGIITAKYISPSTYYNSVELYNKSDKSHGHIISDIAGLSTSLDGKQNKINWLFLATSFSSTPTFLTTISNGDVYEYKYNNNTVTYYRLVPSSSIYIDSFYRYFNGTEAYDLIVTKQG